MTVGGSPFKQPRYTRQADIPANALINDSPEVMCVDELEPDIQIQVITAHLMGYIPNRERWTTGEFALLFCEPSTNMPSPEKAITGHHKCFWVKTDTSQEADQQ